MPRKARSKYGNKKTLNGGLTFDSKREASRWSQLLLMEKMGIISGLERQITFELIPKQALENGHHERSCKYILDFRYQQAGVTICEDSKGKRTADYVIKRKLMLYVHGIEILET